MRAIRLQLIVAVLLVAFVAAARTRVTTPKEQFGFHIGDDYQLATYAQLIDYWKKLATESERMKLVEIGKTAEGRPHLMAILTSPENHKNLVRYKEIARRLALSEGLTDEQARALAAEGRAIVWIDGGLHASEVLGAQQLMELVYQMVSRSDAETLRFLRDVIVLAVHANPDGHDLVAGGYMSEKEPARRRYVPLRLYQKYIGHDNNRDFYMSTQAETINLNTQLYHEWFPQIMYNHHQSGPAGSVLFCPPFRDPTSYFYDPLVPLGIDLVGAAMHNRFAAEGKPGATTREGATFSVWYNGGLRTTTNFHNMIGILTEMTGSPTPMEIPFVPQRVLPGETMRFPITPQRWRFRQSIDYSITANRAVIDVASRYREEFLFNIYRMGKNSIERGSRDHWTMFPSRVSALEATIARQGGARQDGAGRRPGVVATKYFEELRKPELRDPRGYILPADQADFLTATKFMNALIRTGITVHRATSPFSVGGKSYPAGSYVVKTAQPFRPHVLDMFEPQDYPNDIPYPGGPPTAPYDIAGWTLAYQMGVEFDRVLEGFDGPFEKVPGLLKPPAGRVSQSGERPAGYILSHRVNDAFVAVNRLLKNNEEVYWLKDPITAGVTHGPGAMYIPAKASTLPLLRKLAADSGLNFAPVASRPSGDAFQLRPVRIGLWDQLGGSMPSGWVRWLFEQFEFPFEVVYPQTLDAGDLGKKFDVLVFVGGAIPDRDGGGGRGAFGPTPPVESIPAEYRDRMGRVTAARTVPHLRKFVEDGGTIVTLGSSTALAAHLGLPVSDALVERLPNGAERRLTREKFYVPGSVLRVSIDNTNPVAYGMGKEADVFFDNNPVFQLRPDAGLKRTRPVAWFSSATPLRSGWAWGQHYLEGGVAVTEAAVGEGKLFLFGPEVTFRAQPHGVFKLFFNAIYYGPARPVRLENQ